MRSYVWGCVMCAVAGIGIGVFLSSCARDNAAAKQEAAARQEAAELNQTEPIAAPDSLAQAGPPVGPVPQTLPIRPADPARSDPIGGEFTQQELTNIAVYEKVNRAVVNITTKSVRVDAFMFESPTEGSGSGSVLDRHGHILTNHHVIAGARRIFVTLFDGSTFDAELVGEDPPNDVAVLRIEAPAEKLHPVILGDSSRLRVGQNAYAIGNPFGLERTLTTGVISSLNRSLTSQAGRTIKSVIQIDAALNRGNSGGPLLDSQGRLIGMNTAIASRTGENTGVGFAIPVNTIRRVAPELIENGRVVRADIGIAQVYETEAGLVVAAVVPGGPAERAGIRGFRIVRRQERRGGVIIEERTIDRSYADRIVAVDGAKIASADDLLSAVEAKPPGAKVVLSIIREGRAAEVEVTLGEE